jgi:hypothetical protein
MDSDMKIPVAATATKTGKNMEFLFRVVLFATIYPYLKYYIDFLKKEYGTFFPFLG